MSFIFNIFSSNQATPSEKENAAALKVIIKDHKSAIKAEYKQYEIEYKQAVKEAEAEYKRSKQEAKNKLYRSTLEAVSREIDIITATDEYANSDKKTKAKIDDFKSWMDTEAEKHLGERDGEIEVFEGALDEKKNQAPVV